MGRRAFTLSDHETPWHLEKLEYRRPHGYRVMMQGVAMQRPHSPGFNRADAYVIDDWR